MSIKWVRLPDSTVFRSRSGAKHIWHFYWRHHFLAMSEHDDGWYWGCFDLSASRRTSREGPEPLPYPTREEAEIEAERYMKRVYPEVKLD